MARTLAARPTWLRFDKPIGPEGFGGFFRVGRSVPRRSDSDGSGAGVIQRRHRWRVLQNRWPDRRPNSNRNPRRSRRIVELLPPATWLGGVGAEDHIHALGTGGFVRSEKERCDA